VVHLLSVYQRVHGPRCLAATGTSDLEAADGSPQKGGHLARVPPRLLLGLPVVHTLHHYREGSQYVERLSHRQSFMASGSASLPVHARGSLRHSGAVQPLDQPSDGTRGEAPKLDVPLRVAPA